MYAIGERVVYPLHGVGQIKNIESKEVLGQSKQYYIIKIAVSDMTVMIPTDMSEKIGLRSIIRAEKVDKVISILKDDPDVMEDDWKGRYLSNHDKLKSGSLIDICKVVRNLYRRNNEKELSSSEKELFENALQFLVEEVSLAKDMDPVEVEHYITEILEEGLGVYN